MLIFGLVILNVFKPRKPPVNNVIPFRNVHRIEWLKKRRAQKLKNLKDGKK
jgi:hypothetical protein